MFLLDLWVPVYPFARVTARLFCVHVRISCDLFLAAMLFLINSVVSLHSHRKSEGNERLWWAASAGGADVFP